MTVAGDRLKKAFQNGAICVVVVLSLPIIAVLVIGARAILVPVVIVLLVVGAPVIMVPSARTWLCRKVGWRLADDTPSRPGRAGPHEEPEPGASRRAGS